MQAQLRAVVAVNKELILLYWQIGRAILQRQQTESICAAGCCTNTLVSPFTLLNLLTLNKNPIY
jgi:hypothetical protein